MTDNRDPTHIKIHNSLGDIDSSNPLNVQLINNFVPGSYDTVNVTYPTTSTEVYTFKKSGSTVGIITLTYSDAVTKQILVSAVRS